MASLVTSVRRAMPSFSAARVWFPPTDSSAAMMRSLGQVLGQNFAAVAEQRRTHDGVAELADIAFARHALPTNQPLLSSRQQRRGRLASHSQAIED